MSFIVTKVSKKWAIIKEFNDELVQSEECEFSSFPEVEAKRGVVTLLKKPANWKPGDKQVAAGDHRTLKNNKKQIIFKVGEVANVSLKITDTKILNNGVPTKNLYKAVLD